MSQPTIHTLPETLAANPRLDRWAQFQPNGELHIRSGKVELGQGILTAIAQIAADELDVPLSRIRMMPVDTRISPDEKSTTGSRSIQEGGMAMRQACAEIRHAFLQVAAKRWGVSADRLQVVDGLIRDPESNANASYWELADAVDLARDADGRAQPKGIAELRVVGQPTPRLDGVQKVTGSGFIQDIELPGMLHGRMVRPPGYRAKLRGLNDTSTRALPGVVAVVRVGSVVGVVTEHEPQAIAAQAELARHCQWDTTADLPDMHALPDFLRAQPAEIELLASTAASRQATAGRLQAAYTRPYLAHAAIGPSCGLAWWHDEHLEVWSHTQSLYALRNEMAEILGLPREQIVAHAADGSGCYGHNGADDVALDAALLARAVPGRPVRVQWMREEEFQWEPFGPAMTVQIEGALDADGKVAIWDQHIWGNRHISRPGRMNQPGLLAARYLEQGWHEPDPADMPLAMGGGSQRNAVPYYDFAAMAVTNHAVRPNPVRTSALRALGAHLNVFAIESFIDELAHNAQIDPITLRLRQQQDPRARAVIEAVQQAVQEEPAPATDACNGRGFAFARYKNISTYAAVIVEVELEDTVRVRKVWAAVDCGQIINPDGTLNQCEGGILQAISWTLKEQVTFDRSSITSTNWDNYPILRFSEVPDLVVRLIDRPDEPPLGVGEGVTGPVAAAIGNAVFNALGVRVRELPITYERIAAAMV